VTLRELREDYGPRDLLTLLEIIYKENGTDAGGAAGGGSETWGRTSGRSLGN
jgi:hypothetical protein